MIDSLSDESPMGVRKIGIIIGDSDQRRRAEDLMKHQAALDSTKFDSSNEFVFAKLSLMEQKQEEDRLKQEEDRMTDRSKQEEDRLKQEEDRMTDREMLKSVMQMLQQKQNSGMKQEGAPYNSVLFPMLACLLGVVASCLVMWTVGEGRKEKQDVEASIL